MENQENEIRLQALEQKERDVLEREKDLEKRELIVEEMEEKIELGFKENMYSKVKVSVKTMDTIIGMLFVAVFVALVMGFVAGR